jgi:uncharacterized protein YndB with AHSA1/START domain
VTTQTTVTPVEKTVTVKCSVEHAFSVFTDRIGDWWPLHERSISAQDDGTGAPETVVLESGVGGRLFERTAAGEELEWGIVLAWEPPHRVVLEWRPSRTPTTPTEVEVRFTAEGESTRVDLEHRGWERLDPARARESRGNYDRGWVIVVKAYTEAASASR